MPLGEWSKQEDRKRQGNPDQFIHVCVFLTTNDWQLGGIVYFLRQATYGQA